MIAAAFFVVKRESRGRKSRLNGIFCTTLSTMSSYETTKTVPTTVTRSSREHAGLIQLLLFCFLVPCALISFVLIVSPNFSFSTAHQAGPEEHPLGGDIIQEYIGGHLWNNERANLYNWHRSAELQHDVNLVGFEWQESGYFPMVYPPFHYQIASIGAGWSYRNFVFASMFTVAISLSIAAFAFLHWYREIRLGAGAWFFIAILFTPLLLSINMGQKSAVLLAILTVTFVCLHHKRPFAAGLIFGLIAFKPYLAIPIGIAMLCKKQYEFVAGSLVTLSFLVLVSLVASPSSWLEYIQTCLGMTDYLSTGGYQLEHSHSIWGATELLLGTSNPTIVKPISTVALIGLLTLMGRILSGPVDLSSTRFAFQFSALIIATVLISPHFYTYDLTILLLPLAICGLSLDVSSRINRRVLYWLCIAVLFGSSVFVPLSLSTGIQASTIVLFAWLIVIAGGWKAADMRTLAKAA